MVFHTLWCVSNLYFFSHVWELSVLVRLLACLHGFLGIRSGEEVIFAHDSISIKLYKVRAMKTAPRRGAASTLVIKRRLKDAKRGPCEICSRLAHFCSKTPTGATQTTTQKLIRASCRVSRHGTYRLQLIFKETTPPRERHPQEAYLGIPVGMVISRSRVFGQ